MGLIRKPFEAQKLEEDREQDKLIFTCKLNKEERAILDQCKILLEQPKDSTALKTLAWIGAKVIHEEKTLFIITTLFKNKGNNKRLGIVEWEDTSKQK